MKRGLRPSALTLVAAAIGLAGAAVVTVMAARGVTPVEASHTPFHIGCAHHNHGPKWHENHGRILGEPASRFARPERDDADTQNRDMGNAEPLAKRSLTSGR